MNPVDIDQLSRQIFNLVDNFVTKICIFHNAIDADLTRHKRKLFLNSLTEWVFQEAQNPDDLIDRVDVLTNTLGRFGGLFEMVGQQTPPERYRSQLNELEADLTRFLDEVRQDLDATWEERLNHKEMVMKAAAVFSKQLDLRVQSSSIVERRDRQADPARSSKSDHKASR